MAGFFVSLCLKSQDESMRWKDVLISTFLFPFFLAYEWCNGSINSLASDWFVLLLIALIGFFGCWYFLFDQVAT
jgi:hypothetical protein